MIEVPEFYLTTGPSAAGKTFFAKEFAKINQLQYLGIDDFYALINGSELRHEDETDVWLIFYKAIQLAEMHGRSIIVDTNAPTPTKRTQFLDWFPNFNHHLIYITAEYYQCFENNKNRVRQVPADQLDEMYFGFVPPSCFEDDRWKSVVSYRNNHNINYIKFGDFRR